MKVSDIRGEYPVRTAKCEKEIEYGEMECAYVKVRG